LIEIVGVPSHDTEGLLIATGGTLNAIVTVTQTVKELMESRFQSRPPLRS